MQATSENTYKRILECASQLFSEKGYSNVSIRDVCKKSGTTPPVIYYYFGNKRGLFDAVVRERITMEDFLERLESEMEKQEGIDSIYSFVETYIRFFPERVFDIGLYIRDKAELDKKSTSLINKDLERVHNILKSLIEKCINQGLFKRVDPSAAADCLLGMLNHPIFQRIHFSKNSDVETYKKTLFEIFINGIKK